MAATSTKIDQLGSEFPRHSNPWDKWLYMEIKLRPTTNKFRACLDLTINFGEYWFDTHFGKVRFGLSGGELIIDLENGSMPLEERNPKNDLQPAITVKRVHEEAVSTNEESSIGVTTGLKAGPTAVEPSVSIGLNSKTASGKGGKIHDEFNYLKWQITLKGSPVNPVWSFEVKNLESVLEGALRDYEIGAVMISGSPFRLSARFLTSKSEVVITKVEGFLLKTVAPNRAAIGAAFLRKTIWNKLQPYVSSAEMQYV